MRKSKSIHIDTEVENNSKALESSALATLDTITNAAIELPINQVAPKEKVKQSIPMDKVVSVINTVAGSFGIPPQLAAVSIYLLILKGASNLNSPLTLSVEVVYEGQKIEIQKYDLIYAYSKVTGNKYLRRLAESLAVQISQYAEKNILSGDLANKITTRLIADGAAPLTTTERAWASSFCQNLPNLEKYAGERLPQLLAQDYANRYDRNNKSKEKKKATAENGKQPAAAAKKKTASKAEKKEKK